jgi:hypothetical protein
LRPTLPWLWQAAPHSDSCLLTSQCSFHVAFTLVLLLRTQEPSMLLAPVKSGVGGAGEGRREAELECARPGRSNVRIIGRIVSCQRPPTSWLAVPEDGHTPGASTARPQAPSWPQPQRRRRDIVVEPQPKQTAQVPQGTSKSTPLTTIHHCCIVHI